MNSDQEDADTELILHAVDATACGATSIDICSPDTDMLIMAVRCYPELCSNTNTNRKESPNDPTPPYLYALGPAALPTLHTLSGSDNTGSFAGKRKHSF